MAAEKVVGGSLSGGGTSERGAASEEMNGSNKVAMSGGVAGSAYRWNNGDAVPLKRRRVGLRNGASLSDGGEDSSDDEEEEQEEEEEREEDDEIGEDAEEVAPEGYSDHYEHVGAVNGRAPEAVEEEEDEEEAEEEAEEEVEEEEVGEPDEEDDDDDDDQHLVTASMDYHRGGIGGNRGRDSRHGFADEHEDVGTEDEGYEEDEHHRGRDSPPPVPRARGVSHREREKEKERERERERELELASSPEEVEGRDEMEESDDERGLAPSPPPPPVVSRGMIERVKPSAVSSASDSHQRHNQHKREAITVVRVPEKPARGMMDTAKRKAVAAPAPAPAPVPALPAPAANVVVAEPPRNGSMVEPKPKKAPAAPRKKGNGGDGGTTTTGGNRERTRFSTDNKARVTLERAREILAAVKAAMMKDPKHCTVRHSEKQAAVENSSGSEGDRRGIPMQHQNHHPAASSRAPVHQQQQHTVKMEEKVVKKRSRAAIPKAEKEPTPRRRKQPKVENDYQHVAEEKSAYNRSRPQQVEAYDHHSAYKMGHFSTSGAEHASREGREIMMTEDHRSNGYSRNDGMVEQQQITAVEKKVRKRRKTKDGEDSASATGLCPGSVIRDENWAPPTSPFGLIQESLYKDPWKVLLSCMLLNKTAGRQMHKVIWDLFSLCPDAETAINMDTAKIAEKVYSLGLQNKRAKMIQRFSSEYLRGDWTNVTQLHGIGKYAADAYAIFCQGLWREVEPDDLMLNKYWKWLWETNGQGTAFVPETS